MTNLTAWECPVGLTVDPSSRYSGCIINIDLAKFIGWANLLLQLPLIFAMFVTGIRLHLDNPKSSPARVEGLIGISVGMSGFLYTMSYPVFDPHTPFTTDRATSLACGIGSVIFCVGGFRYTVSHLLASVFQMV
jgi:hypothetical protein